jgi:2-haloacid dehalogenase
MVSVMSDAANSTLPTGLVEESENTHFGRETSQVMPKYKWLLFDADGTLFDYDKAEASALQRTFAAFELDFQGQYAQTYREINEEIWLAFERGEITQIEIRTERFERLSKAIGIDFDSTKFSQTYLKLLGEGAFLLEGAEELLAELESAVGIMLITNGLKDVQRSRLAHSTIQHYFTDVIISEEVGAAKPDEAIFEAAFEKMGNPLKTDVIIIGDSLTSDIRGGNRFGIDTCWFNPEGRINDQNVNIRYEIRQLKELPAILE